MIQTKKKLRLQIDELQRRISKAIDILDEAIGDTDPDEIDYYEHPEVHAMHVLLGIVPVSKLPDTSHNLPMPSVKPPREDVECFICETKIDKKKARQSDVHKDRYTCNTCSAFRDKIVEDMINLKASAIKLKEEFENDKRIL